MKLIKKHGMLNSYRRVVKPKTIVIHHTAGGNLSGAESALRSRGLGYHYMIDKDGTCYEYGPPSRKMYHAYKRNTGTIGISYVGGRTPDDAINPQQYQALIDLIKYIKGIVPTLTEVTGHKHIDPRTKSSRWPAKPDPYWPGDTHKGYVDGHNWDNDSYHMNRIADLTGLKFVSKLKPNMKKGY